VTNVTAKTVTFLHEKNIAVLWYLTRAAVILLLSQDNTQGKMSDRHSQQSFAVPRKSFCRS